ncbi:MAG: glutaredoxin [Dehalococcoidia bacterium]|nr:glutaredoxin [Dehalococcoidia bacterium]
MPAIPDKDKQALKDRFKKELKNDVTIRLFTQRTFGLTIPGRECRYCDQTQALMEELAALSPKLHMEVKDFYSETKEVREACVDRIPAIVLTKGAGSNVKFYGIPAGHEFTTVLDDIVTLSRGVSPLSLDTRKKLKRLKEDVHIQVFVTPTCEYCPPMARVAHAMAMENNHIRADVVEVQEFPLVAQRYMISSVPKTVINNRVQFVGAVSEAVLMDKVLEAAGLSPEERTTPAFSTAPELGPSTRQSA